MALTSMKQTFDWLKNVSRSEAKITGHTLSGLNGLIRKTAIKMNEKANACAIILD